MEPEVDGAGPGALEATWTEQESWKQGTHDREWDVGVSALDRKEHFLTMRPRINCYSGR